MVTALTMECGRVRTYLSTTEETFVPDEEEEFILETCCCLAVKYPHGLRI